MMTTAAEHVDDEPIRIFVGTDQTQLVPALVLTHSLCRSRAVQRLEIFFFKQVPVACCSIKIATSLI